MRKYLVTLTELKHYIVETENEDWSPEDLAREFLVHDGNQVMNIELAGYGPKTLDVVEMTTPEEHFYDEMDDDDTWEQN